MANKSKANLFILLFCLALLGLSSGCATQPMLPAPVVEGIPGFYHRMEKGQTLWRISKIYNIGLDDLVQLNRIEDVRSIEIGQLIFIPEQKITEKTPKITYPNNQEDFLWPLKGRVIASFSNNPNNVLNKGIDIKAPYGSDVTASRSGIVSFYSDELGGLGETLIVDHGDNFLTVYTRISGATVKVGERVAQGNTIAKVGYGARDRNSYLHFEIRKGSIPQNPYYYLP